MGRSSFPPGFRFHPTDVELVLYYLKRKIMGKVLRFEFIEELDLYKFAPWDLPDKSCLKSNDLEWYFFCPRDKKYACGARMNRATEIGYWKTTGRDRDVSCNLRTVGMKKTLVFHVGRAPRGDRTNWVMHEYRLQDKDLVEACISQDAYVLCKIFEKGGSGPRNGEQHLAPFREEDWEDEDDSVTCIAVKSSEVACPSSPLVLPSSDNNVSMEKTMFVGESTCCSSPQKIPCEILLANTREESPPSMLTREESPLSMLVGGSIYCSSLKTMPCQTLQANTRDETLPLPQEDDIEKLMELFGDEDCGNVTNEAYTREEYPPVLQEDNIEKLMQVFGDEDCGNYNYEMPHSYNPGNTVETSLPLDGVDIYSNLEDLNNYTSQVPIDNFLLPNSLGESLSRDHMLPAGDNAFFLELDDLARPMKYPMEAYRSEFVHNDLLDSLQTYESTIGIRDSFNPSPTLEDNHTNQTATSWGYGGDMENPIIPSDGKAQETDIDMWFNGLGKR